MASYSLHEGDCLIGLKKLQDNSIDSIVTDPPYGISFMNKKWDYDIPSVDIWKECLRVLKPGGHMLAACGTRTQHRMAVNIEDAGFEIRDVVSWLYGQGFPKSTDISKQLDKAAGAERVDLGPSPYANKGRTPTHNSMSGAGTDSLNERITVPATPEAQKWSGWGTALKPACEFWTLCRKPLSESTIAKNVLKHGTGGLNIDVSRIGYKSEADKQSAMPGDGKSASSIYINKDPTEQDQKWKQPEAGRFPANVIFDEAAAEVLDGQSGEIKSGGGNKKSSDSGMWAGKKPQDWKCEPDSGGASRFFKNIENDFVPTLASGRFPSNVIFDEEAGKLLDEQSGFLKPAGNKTISHGDKIFGSDVKTRTVPGVNSYAHEGGGGASRFFYCAKASKAERNAGLEGLPMHDSYTEASATPMRDKRKQTQVQNNHPTVKPIKLMEYLIKLVTPEARTVLDPFMGSGTTGIAALKNGFSFVGMEMNPEYLLIAKERMKSFNAVEQIKPVQQSKFKLKLKIKMAS